MTHLVNNAEDFADQALDGLVAAHSGYVRKVHGGVVRATQTEPGQVAVVIGGGTGHYPAFPGWVGPGLAHGAACGNIFASPSASQVYSVLRAANQGGGILLSFGNYTGDVIHFGQAADRVRDEGIDVARPEGAHEHRSARVRRRGARCAGQVRLPLLRSR